MRAVFYYFGISIAVLAASMLLPVLVAAGTADMRSLAAFLLSGILTAFVAGAMIFALGGRDFQFARMHILLLTVSVWVLAPLFGALPIYITEATGTFWLSYIEAVSGFTTTGASVLKSVDATPPAVIAWRASLQWLGGATTLVSILLLLAPANLGGTPDSPLSTMEGASGSAGARIKAIAARLLPAFGAMTAACFILLVLIGIPAFDALCIAFSTLSTGGFSPVDGGLGQYDLPVAELVVALFMWVGASSIIWHRLMLQQKWAAAARHREAWWLAAVIALAGFAFGWGFYTGIDGPSGLDALTSLQQGIVTASSVVTTTGFEVRAGGFAAISLPLLLLLCIVGGGGFSTAGGVKFFRIGAMLVQAGQELRVLVHPHSIRSARFGSHHYDLQLMKGMWAVLMAIGGTIGCVAGILTATGMGFEASLTAAVAAISNIGPVYTTLQPAMAQWPAFSDFGPLEHSVMLIAMVAGRLEILALLSLFSPVNWRR